LASKPGSLNDNRNGFKTTRRHLRGAHRSSIAPANASNPTSVCSNTTRLGAFVAASDSTEPCDESAAGLLGCIKVPNVSANVDHLDDSNDGWIVPAAGGKLGRCTSNHAIWLTIRHAMKQPAMSAKHP
jgi:hypothetical protein